MASGFLNQGNEEGGPVLRNFDSAVIATLDLRALPLLLSGFFLFVQVVYATLYQLTSRGRNAKIKDCPRRRGNHLILAFTVARGFGTLSLLYLSATTSRRGCDAGNVEWGVFKICSQDYLTIAFAYATVSLVGPSLLPNKRWLSPMQFHVVSLLSALGVYVHRDIWPLATNYGQQPADILEGKILWIKIALLFITAVIVPLFIPHLYVPIDPKNPAPEPNPEQTASWISSLTFSFVDTLIRLANKVPHLREDQLFPLADYDTASYLTSTASMYIDPFAGAKRRHLFFSLLSYFRKESLTMAGSMFLMSAFSFAAPIGINRTLSHLESRQYGDEMTVKPWVWISLMLLGPIFQSISDHWSLFVQTKVRVRIQVILTHLIFEHSLRIRMKAEISGEREYEPAEEKSSAGLDSSTSSLNETGQGHEDNGGEASTIVGTREASPASQSTRATVKQCREGKRKADEGPAISKPSRDAENLIGKINNLVTTDLENIVVGCGLFSFLVYVPSQIILSIIFLYNVLGWSAMAGLFTTIVLGPIPGYVSKLTQDVQVTKMKYTDARVQAITEAVGVLRMIKLFGWEGKMKERIETQREEELTWLWKIKKLKLSNELASAFIPTLSMLATYAVYTVLMKEGLTASKIFSSMAVFQILREQLGRIVYHLSSLVEAKVSLDRANYFLQNTELLDKFAKEEEISFSGPTSPEEEVLNEIGFRNSTFSWSLGDEDGSLSPPSRKYELCIDGELHFKKNAINLIVGPTGSGKTSMLMALLGEMHFVPSRTDAWFNLPRHGGIAYAAQESWVQNATIKENILFGSSFDEERYKKVIRQCALEHDLELFDAGDETEVGERGLTLSGGQKARVTLARAIYSSAGIVLLDDVLAALDVHTSAWIVENCFHGDLVKGRTLILVTHNVALVAPVADIIISLGLDGSITVTDNTPAKTIAEDNEAMSTIHTIEEGLDVADVLEGIKHGKKRLSTAPIDGKLVVAEEIVEGHITWRSMRLLFIGLGGKHPRIFTLYWFTGMLLSQFFRIIHPWFLGIWGSQYENRAPSEVNLKYYLLVFTALAFGRFISFSILNFYYTHRSISASRIIHSELVKSVFGSTLRWLDETPTARIIARCTQDIRSVDGPIPQSLMMVADQTLGMICTLGSIVLFAPIFLFPGIGVAALGIFVGNSYLRAQLSIKREMSNARSPVLAHFSAAIHGIVSIRAYGSQTAFRSEILKRIDHYSRTARTSWIVNRWVGFRIDALGASFTALLAFYLVYGPGSESNDSSNNNAGNAGFLLNLAVSFCGYLFWLIREFNDLEVESNSLERIQGYIDIDHEPEPTISGEPPAAWPTSGDLRVEGLSARYSQTSPKILHDLTFHIASGERIGIVGRTGSGKSSLTLSLLRCILTEGKVLYDGVDTGILNLDALRSNVTIIPQTPELLSGTLRQNLDPFEQNDDATLNDALRSAGLFSLQHQVQSDSDSDSGSGAGEARLTLESKIAGGGNNLSVGQRQILALARAIVRGSKLLILDEATSAIDYNTDSIIQNTLRTKLGSDVTVITVAHRLQSIMDADRIMVLENGRIAEFDTPNALLKKEDGTLRALVDASGDRALLYSLTDKNIATSS